MNRREEHNEKIARVRTWLAAHKMEGALFTTQGNFSWIMAGGEAHVSLGGDAAVGNILVTLNRVVLLTNVIERSRLLEEELGDLEVESVTWPWHKSGGIEEAAAKFAGLPKIVVDRPHSTPFAHIEGMVELRYVLLPMEVDRYRRLVHDAAEVVEGVCRSVTPGQTELEVAALVAKGCMERGVLPLVNLVAVDDRIKRYRHPLPTKKSVQNTVMVVLTGRRNGLHASLTRIVAFGKLDGSIQRRHQSVTKVDAAYILGSRPGRALNEVLADGLRERSLPPSKFIFGGKAPDSMVSDGCIISGGTVWKSILSPGVVVERDAFIEASIIFDDVNVEPGARIKRAIIDTGVRIRSGVSIGYDLEADARKGCTISDKGIVVVPEGMVIGLD